MGRGESGGACGGVLIRFPPNILLSYLVTQAFTQGNDVYLFLQLGEPRDRLKPGRPSALGQANDHQPALGRPTMGRLQGSRGSCGSR